MRIAPGLWGAGRLSPANLLAGLALAAVAVPEQMATAGLAGFPAGAGLAAFVAGALGFALFGASRSVSTGADSTIAPLFAGTLAVTAAEGSPHYLALAGALALAVGLALLIAGAVRASWLADLVSTPVAAGFLAGIAARIAINEIAALLGAEHAPSVVAELRAIAAAAHGLDPAPVILGGIVLLVMLLAERLDKRVPGALIGLIAAALLAALFSAIGVGAPRLDAAPPRLPHPALTLLGLGELKEVLGLALVVCLVVMLQTTTTSQTFPAPGETPDLDADLMGVGAGNVLAALFGAFPVNASPPRTAIARDSGATSQWASLVAAAAVAALFAFGAPLLRLVPKAALPGILLFVAGRIFPGARLVQILRRTPAEFALALTTLLLVVLLPIQTGVGLGVVLSLAHGLFTATRASLIAFERRPGTSVWWPAAKPPAAGGALLVVGFQAPLSFMIAPLLKRRLLQVLRQGAPQLRLLVLEASGVAEIDYTAGAALIEAIAAAKSQGVAFAVARLESLRARAAFERLGILDALGQDRLFETVEEAVRALSPDGPLAASGPPAPTPGGDA